MVTGNPTYDVVIMGGGPAGASLGAVLARESSLSVAIYEKDLFPREHIGESLSSLIVPCLQETGALAGLLESDCYVKKFGGYYAWNSSAPSVSFFRHDEWEQDGYFRWSVHVNRSEFDEILLQHAKDSGVDVFEGVAIRTIIRECERTHLQLSDGNNVNCSIFVDASGRQSSVNPCSRKAFLSRYRNIAIWGHFTGGKPAQSLPGDWNIFRDFDVSPIGCFAFRDGWFWYIPVPKHLAGRRVATHSLGVVTDPRVLREGHLKLTDQRVFLDTAHQVPLLNALIVDIKPVYEHLLTATNYSMISSRMCDYDEGWILIGDSAYFVDPLFSSGVNFALVHALLASHVIRAAFNPAFSETSKRHLWNEYNLRLTDIARAFALAIDQWYSGIAEEHPDSVYWGDRAARPTFEFRRETLRSLINGDFGGDLLRILTRGSGDVADLGEGPISRAYRALDALQISPSAGVRMRSDVILTKSITLDYVTRPNGGKPSAIAHGPYWTDPIRFAGEVIPLCPGPTPCYRYQRVHDPDANQITVFPDYDRGVELYEILRESTRTYGQLDRMLTEPQKHLLREMYLADMLVVEEALSH
jgi:flavin-dependent dehydrogenase